MRWSAAVALIALSLAFALASVPNGCQCGEESPVVVIDIEASNLPDLMEIDSTYSGEGPRVYAFLVALSTPDGYLSAYDVGFEVISPDSSLLNMGFTRLPGWVGLDSDDKAFPADVAAHAQRVPVAIGYWTLALTKGWLSSGRVRIVPNAQNSSSAPTLIDGQGKTIQAAQAFRGYVNILRGTPADSALSVRRWWPLDCLGEPITEVRSTNYVLGQVIARFAPGSVVLTEGSRSGCADNIASDAVRDAAFAFGLDSIKRVCRNAEPGGSEVLRPDGRSVRLLDMSEIYLLIFPAQRDVWAIVDALRELPECVYAEPNFKYGVMRVPNDHYCRFPYLAQQRLFRIQAHEAFGMEVGDEAVRIAIVDLGVAYAHPDLGGGLGPGYKVVDGWDYADDDADPVPVCWEPCGWDDESHGTGVAGVAAALTNNEIGIAGVAGGWADSSTGCSIVALRCDACKDTISGDKAIDAINDACTVYGCQIVNASWGGPDYSEALRSAIFNAHAAGVVFVASDGYIDEENPHNEEFPNDYDYDWVICVGASTMADPPDERRVHYEDVLMWCSEYEYGLDVMAPGDFGGCYSTRLRFLSGAYDWMSFSGTSSAAPQVAGIAGLLRSHSPWLCPDDIEGLICASCTDIITDVEGGDSLFGYDQWSGWGRVCADSCLRFLHPLLSPFWRVYWHNAIGAVSAISDGFVFPFRMIGEGAPHCPSEYPFFGQWKAQRFDLRCDIDYPAGYCAVRIWGRGYNASTGWSAAEPNYMAGFCRVVDGSRTLTGCQLQAYTYMLYYYREGCGWCPYAWRPAPPNEIMFAYSSLGCPGEASVAAENSGTLGCSASLRVTPNPASTVTSFSLTLPQPGPVSLRLYRVDGSLVRVVHCGNLDRGHHSISWDGRDGSGRAVAPGIYVYELTAQESRVAGKVVWVR